MTFHIFSLYLGERLDIKSFLKKQKKYLILSKEQPIILKTPFKNKPNQFISITKFGVINFWNVSKKERDEFIKEILPYIENYQENFYYSDVFKVFVDKRYKKNEIKNGKLYLTKINKKEIQVISLVISQSTALEKYEKDTEEKILTFENLIASIKQKSILPLKERKILNQIGNILSVKQKIISHLSLLDKPDMVWEDDNLEKIYNKLYYEFDLTDRLDTLNEKIEFLSDYHKILLDFISAQRSNLLEIIIILLIAIEIIIFIPEFLKLLN